jgi:chaperonin cofactor prefoldin
MIIATVTCIMLLLNSGHAGLFSFEVFKQSLETSIADDTRADQVEDLIDAADDEMKTYSKSLGDVSEKLLKLTRDYNTKRENLDQFLAKIDRDHESFQERLIQIRMKIKQNVTQEEWASIYAGARAAEKK